MTREDTDWRQTKKDGTQVKRDEERWQTGATWKGGEVEMAGRSGVGT